MKRSETPQNMSFGSNGVDQVRSLRKILKQLHLANYCVNGTSSASFATTFVQYRNGLKHPKALVFGLMQWIEVDQVCSLQKISKQLCLANVCVKGTCSASFGSAFFD
jgi:hypothetical protein